MSIPTPSTPTCTVYDDFKDEFLESWTDTNEPYSAAAELAKLHMKHDDIDTYITCFAELAHKALYHENDPTVLEKFKAGLPLELLVKCMHHNDPHNWDAWMRSAHMRQAILTSLKNHKADKVTQQSPPPTPMEIDKVYTIPAQRELKTLKDTEWQRGLCHLCKGQGHIQHYCPKKAIEALVPIMHAKVMKVSPLVSDQGLKRP